MAKVERKAISGMRTDGSSLGGPGPTPQKPEPATILVTCPKCNRRVELPTLAMANKLLNQAGRGEGEVEIAPATKRAFDAISPLGWDARCGACGAEMRICHGLEEWGKMSGAFFPTICEMLYRS